MRTNNNDLNNIVGLYAAFGMIETACEEMETRVRSIHNGWRDFKCISTMLKKLAGNIVATVPQEKTPNLRRLIRRAQMRIVIGPQAAVPRDETVIGYDDLDVLVLYARDACKMCPDWTKCNSCKLGKTLDHLMRYDRNGKSWALVPDREMLE